MSYVRDLLKDVEGYVPGEQMNAPGVVKLNTNENPYPPSPRAREALQVLGADALRRYPDPVSRAFRAVCAERYGYGDPDWVIIGNGMDELLAMVLRTFVDPGDTVIAQYPTYSLYEVLCKLHGANLQYIALDDNFGLTEDFFSARGRLCFLTRPNAPTGQVATRDEVARFCEGFDGIVVIDEAYVDFAEDSCMDFPRKYENVIVMRTFSKSFSMAGMRIGTAVARPELIGEFMKTKDSYNMNAASQAAGRAAMLDYDHMLQSVEKVKGTREKLIADLREIGFAVASSQANFVLAKWAGEPSAKTLFEQLRARNILVRYFNAPRLEDALRITVGTDAECAALIEALDELTA